LSDWSTDGDVSSHVAAPVVVAAAAASSTAISKNPAPPIILSFHHGRIVWETRQEGTICSLKEEIKELKKKV
jgi:hypothetical protein